MTTRCRRKCWRRRRHRRRESSARNSFETRSPHPDPACQSPISSLLGSCTSPAHLEGVLGLRGSISSPRTPNVGMSAREPLLVSTFNRLSMLEIARLGSSYIFKCSGHFCLIYDCLIYDYVALNIGTFGPGMAPPVAD